jgi:hypothetical protein
MQGRAFFILKAEGYKDSRKNLNMQVGLKKVITPP